MKRCVVLVLAAGLIWADEGAWSERETRLANEYLGLLVERPETGRVLDLLWDLYQKHDSTALLLDNIHNQAASSGHPSVLLVEAQLWRKSGDLAKAATLLDEVLKKEPANAIALRSRAEVATEQGQPELALKLQQRIAESLPDTDAEKPGALLQLGNLWLTAGKADEAARAWLAAAKLRPADLALSRTVSQLLLRAGQPEQAVALLEALAKQAAPAQRLEALSDLARVQEHADQFTRADAALGEALGLLDFRDARYAEFFLRRVRLHERAGTLGEFHEQLKAQAKKTPVTEQALYDMARLCAIIAEPDERVGWLRELTKRMPDAAQYRWELVRALLDHEGAAEAAALLDAELKGDERDAPAVVLLRAEADLRQGKTAEAVARLKRVVESAAGVESEKAVLAFAQERTLEAVVELILQRRVARDSEKPEAVFELATFLRAHERGSEAVTLLREYAGRATQPADKARRLNDAAAFLAAGGNEEEALALQGEAAKLTQEGREELVRLADFMAGAGHAADAVSKLEAAYDKASTLDERVDIDDRLYSVLLGGQPSQAAPTPKPAGTANEFRMPAIWTGAGFGSDAPAEGKTPPKLPAVLTDYAQKLIDAGTADKATDAQMLRAAWWASRVGQRQVLYPLLTRLMFEPGDERKPRAQPVEVSRLLLDFALADENPLLVQRLLKQLIDADPPNRVQYLLRLAEQHLADNQAQLAVTVLERALRDQPDNETVLSALTQCLQLLRQPDKAVSLWQAAIKRASGNAATPLRERYAALLLSANRLGDFVEAQMEIIEAETDIKRRRDIFKRFLDQLLWSDALGGEVAQQVMMDRLKLVETRLVERTHKHPFDGFYHEALAAVFQKRGDAQKAFAAMKQAYYTSPDTPFSLDQLRAAALGAGDLKAAIYFQRQIAATAPTKELAAESRTLIQLLEQSFQIAEADKVRRRLENRLSQDPVALEDLAQYYKETGQDEAERRVYEQIQRVRSWDARSTLRLALKCLALGDHAAAEPLLKQMLERAVSRNSLRTLPPERWPYPLSDERKAGAGTMKDIVELVDDSHGLREAEVERLRTFLGLPRPEFNELPDDVSLLRLRGLELMAMLKKEQGGEALTGWVKTWQEEKAGPVIERLWALYYAGDGDGFSQLLTASIGQAGSVDLQFVHAWLLLRAGQMKKAMAWMQEETAGSEAQAARRRIMQSVIAMLGEWDKHRFSLPELKLLGRSGLLGISAMMDMLRRLQDRQQFVEAIALVESMRQTMPDRWSEFSTWLAGYAQAAELWDDQRRYLHDALREPPQAGSYASDGDDPFLASVIALHRLARTPQERDAVVEEALERLASSPPSELTTMRRAAIAALAGAAQPAAQALGKLATRGFVTTRAQNLNGGGAVMSQSVLKGEEVNFMRDYWNDVRTFSTVFSQQGLAPLAGAVDEQLNRTLGGVQLGPRTSDTFGLWRTARLIRQMQGENYPTRRRLIREYLASCDMREEDAVEVLLDLGRELELAGMMRECIDIYQQLPGRAPTNNVYAEYFIRACQEAWEPEPGREYVESLFGKDPLYKPQGIGDERLREHHAHFLAMQMKADRLRQLAWKPEGFTRVLRGRIAHEVPYARELALLMEHDGDEIAALQAWNQMHAALINGTPDNPLPPDPECALHRAKLLVKHESVKAALKVLREVPMGKDGMDEMMLQLLKLRATLAAQAGEWDDLRVLMALAVERKVTELVLAITDELHKTQRNTEALNFLTQAERAMKGREERFVLRLEQLRFYAEDTSWSPSTGRSQVAALFRSGGRQEAVLKRLAGWFAFQTARASEWEPVLKAEARTGGDPMLAALALCALPLKREVLPDEVTAAWKRATDQDRVCLELTARQLLARGRAQEAWAVCEVLKTVPAVEGRRLLPITAEVAGALKDEARLREIYAELVRMPSPGGMMAPAWAESLEKAGHPELARELFDLAEAHALNTAKPDGDLTRAHVEFLIAHRNFAAAETLLLSRCGTFLPQTAPLLVKLYREWGRLDSLQALLPRFYLPEAVVLETKFLARKK